MFDKTILKKILVKINPTYRKLNAIQNELASFKKQLENIQNQLPFSKVYINDYSNYFPKYRSSLKESRIGEILEKWYSEHKEEVIELLAKFCSFNEFFEKIPIESISNSSPQWKNDFIPPLDAISIYGFLALTNPRFYVEVGSGNTTLFAAQSIRDNNLRTKIISIDPFPRAEIDKLCHKIYRVPFENMELDFFDSLSDEDIFLMDGSHRSFPNSDVTVFFTEVLPKLPSGILYALHDILLPSDYPEQWSSLERRWYNEQYLLCAYLIGGGDGDKIISPNSFVGRKQELFQACNSLWGKGKLLDGFQFGGGFFWLKRR